MGFVNQIFLYLTIFQNNIQVYVNSHGIEIGCRDMKLHTFFSSLGGTLLLNTSLFNGS